MLYKFVYKLDENRSIFSTLQFTTLVLYSEQIVCTRTYEYYCTRTRTLYCISVHKLTIKFIYTVHLYQARSVHRGPGATF